MKFLAILAESGAADTLSKITEFVSKLCKDKVMLRIARESVFLISAGTLANNGCFLQITLNVNEFFSTYIMGGVSEEYNEIYMELDKDYLYRCMSAKDRSTKIRLVKLGNTPHLKVEQKSCGMIHEMPVHLIPTRHWKTYDVPAMNNVQVALYLPALHTVRSLVNSFKNMGVKYMVIKGSQEGELQFCGDLDMANVVVHFSNLANVSTDHAAGDGTEDPTALRTVRVDIRPVHAFLRSLATGFNLSRILLKIVPEKMAIFTVEQNEASVLYVVSGNV